MMAAKKTCAIIAVILLTVLCFTYGCRFLSSPETYADLNNTIDENTNSVLLLTSSAVALSTAITVIPDDIGTPVAQELAELSDAFGFILIILFAEKYLMPLIGIITCRFIVPPIAILLIWGIIKENKRIISKAITFLVFAGLLTSIIPASVKCSSLIDDTYKQSIETTLSSVSSTAENIKGLKSITQEIREKNISSVHRCIESFAVMVVTSIVIPVVTALIFYTVVKRFTGLDLITGAEKASTTLARAHNTRKSIRHSIHRSIPDKQVQEQEQEQEQDMEW